MSFFFFFFFNDTATTDIYTLSLHDALPISAPDTFTDMLQARVQRLNTLITTIDHTLLHLEGALDMDQVSWLKRRKPGYWTLILAKKAPIHEAH